MCGIAGYSLSAESRIDRTLAAQTLLTAIAERGSDAVGYAYREPSGDVVIHKQRTGASELLEAISIPDGATQVLLHVRDYTKGHPSLAANNHPIRHGAVVGIHNGIIANDEEIFALHGFQRAEPGMTVDSEAIFALVEEADDRRGALEELYGSMATAWLDDRIPEALFLARGLGRPLWIGEAERETFFASTRDAFDLLGGFCDVRLAKRELAEGSAVRLEHGRTTASVTFSLDRSFVEEELPAVRAPGERFSCLERLALITERREASLGISSVAR
jgi:glucosamine 6-phosphate synthetase-like amidotransferase/phosphosugar isomerase protein